MRLQLLQRPGGKVANPGNHFVRELVGGLLEWQLLHPLLDRFFEFHPLLPPVFGECSRVHLVVPLADDILGHVQPERQVRRIALLCQNKSLFHPMMGREQEHQQVCRHFPMEAGG